MIRDEHIHRLGLTKAIAQLQLLAKDLEKQYARKVSSYESSWKGKHKLKFVVKYMRATVKGQIWVTEDKAVIEYELPFLLRRMSKLISQKIINRFERYFPFDHRRAA